tara:strand:+ start:547 stop:879 length:333 start_codon:yes stop_codon:yes gene_type:complete
MGRFITTTGTANVVTIAATTAYSASVNDRILCDSASTAFTVTLPANATLLEGDQVQIIDVGGAFNTNNVTVGRNGSLIQEAGSDLVLDVNGAIVTLLFTGNTYGWVITSS